MVEVVAGKREDFTFLDALYTKEAPISGTEAIFLKDEIVWASFHIMTLSCDINDHVFGAEVLHHWLRLDLNLSLLFPFR